MEDKIEEISPENRIQAEMEGQKEKFKKIREPTPEVQNLKNTSSRQRTDKVKEIVKNTIQWSFPLVKERPEFSDWKGPLKRSIETHTLIHYWKGSELWEQSDILQTCRIRLKERFPTKDQELHSYKFILATQKQDNGGMPSEI